MKIFHRSYSDAAPQIKVGEFAFAPANNLFDGIFGHCERDVAASHLLVERGLKGERCSD